MRKRPTTRETIARNLQTLMERSGMKQMELAKRAGVSQKTISNMLNPGSPGISSQTIDKVDRVAAAFGLNAWHLLMPSLPEDLAECRHISDLVADYIATPKRSRGVILHTAEREKKLAGHE